MPRNKEKIERNKIREKYAREFAAKLRKKDADIAALCRKNDGLRDEVRRLKEKSALDQVTIQRLDELVKLLQSWTELSDQELENVKTDLARKARLMEQAEKLDGAMDAMGRMLGATLSRNGVQSMLYSLLQSGK